MSKYNIAIIAFEHIQRLINENATLVPSQANFEAYLNSHFAKYGTLSNITFANGYDKSIFGYKTIGDKTKIYGLNNDGKYDWTGNLVDIEGGVNPFVTEVEIINDQLIVNHTDGAVGVYPVVTDVSGIESDIVNLQSDLSTLSGITSDLNALEVIVSGMTTENRYDSVSPYQYMGKAPYGSIDTDSTWSIVRMLVNNNGTVTTASVNGVKWTDRLTTIYN